MPKYKINYVTVYSYMFDTYDWGKLEIPYHAYSLIPNALAEDIFLNSMLNTWHVKIMIMIPVAVVHGIFILRK
jgi:hypothetical protein